MLKVGQTVFLKSQDWNHKEIVTETTVAKVGRKYFEIAEPGYGRSKFSVETMGLIQDYGSTTTRCYLTRQEIEDEKERVQLRESLKKVFDGWGSVLSLSLDQLRRIDVIVKEVSP